jgi:hypothetical protein
MSARLARSTAWALALGAAALVLGGVGALSAPGCAEPAELVTPPGSDLDGGPDAAQDGGGGAPAVKRTIEQRNPYGNVALVDNLLWDGDFEWSTPFADQYGWLTGTIGGYISYTLPTIAIGIECISGVKCAKLAKHGVLVGVGVASVGHPLQASFAARLSTGDCASTLGAFLFPADEQQPLYDLVPDQVDPDQAGVCTYRVIAPELPSSAWLYIENDSDADVIVDDAVVQPVTPSASVSRSALLPAAWTAARAAWARPEIRRALRPRDPPPSPVLRAFEQRMRGRR